MYLSFTAKDMIQWQETEETDGREERNILTKPITNLMII
jgi:hypothetical protein